MIVRQTSDEMSWQAVEHAKLGIKISSIQELLQSVVRIYSVVLLGRGSSEV